MEIRKFEGMEYLIRYPEGYTEGERYPVVLFLHGAGTRGDSAELLKKNLFVGLADRYPQYRFVTLAPHSGQETWFDCFETLKRFTAAMAKANFADPRRIYLVGNSMGGYGVWQLAMSMPEAFAAALPICGGGMAWNAGRLRSLPVWAFHGDADPTVAPEESIRMVEAVNAKGGNARLTLYPDVRHNSWSPTFEDPRVFAWLFAQRKGGNSEGEGESEGEREVPDEYGGRTATFG